MTIKQVRIINRLTQRDMAKLLEVTQACINKWERQDVKINLKTVKKIEATFGIYKAGGKVTSYDVGDKYVRN